MHSFLSSLQQALFVTPTTQLFEPRTSLCSVHLLTHIYRTSGAADLIVCEINKERRQSLEQEVLPIVPNTRILGNNNCLLSWDFSMYDWALTYSDPNGHKHPMAVLQHISRQVRGDFILTLNRASHKRHMALGDKSAPDEKPMIRGSRTSKENYFMDA